MGFLEIVRLSTRARGEKKEETPCVYSKGGKQDSRGGDLKKRELAVWYSG
jgi:hypothetical protein